MKARQASCESSSWASTFLSRGCLRGSLVQLQRRSLPRALGIITLLRVLFGGGLERERRGDRDDIRQTDGARESVRERESESERKSEGE